MTETPQATLSNWRKAPHNTWGFSHVDRLVKTDTIKAGTQSAPLSHGPDLDLDAIRLSSGQTVSEALDASFTDGFMILREGEIVAERYGPALDADTPHIVFSVSKSITATVAGVLVERGELDVDLPVIHYLPELAGTAYGDCTVRHVLDMTVAIEFNEDYLDPKGDVSRYRVAMDWDPEGNFAYEGGLHAFIATMRRGEGAHGDKFHYVSPNSDALGWILERASGLSMADILTRYLWQPMGAGTDGLITVDRQGGARTAGGICTTLSDLARIGELMRLKGRVGDRQVIPQTWIDDILEGGDHGPWARGDMTDLFASARYRSKWYIPDQVPGEFCAIGIHGQWIYVDPVAGLTIVKLSCQPIPADDDLDALNLDIFRSIGKDVRAR